MEFMDLLTVIICALLYFFLDALWHSSYFFAHILSSGGEKKKNGWWGRAAASFVLVFFVAFFENYLQVVHFWDGVIAGAICAFGCIVPTHFFLFLRGVEKRAIFLLESGLAFINLMLVGGILAG